MFKGYKELQKTKISEAYDSRKNDEATTRPDFGTKFKDIPKAVWLLVCHSLIHIKTCSFRHLHHVSILMQYFVLFYFIMPGDKNIIWDRCIMFFLTIVFLQFSAKESHVFFHHARSYNRIAGGRRTCCVWGQTYSCFVQRWFNNRGKCYG